MLGLVGLDSPNKRVVRNLAVGLRTFLLLWIIAIFLKYGHDNLTVVVFRLLIRPGRRRDAPQPRAS